MRDYLLVLLSVVGIGLVVTPNLSVAKDQEIVSSKVAEVADLDKIPAISEKTIEAIAESAEIATPVYTARATSNVSSNNFEYSVNNYTSGVNVDPGNFINKVSGGRLVYAHNDSDLMLSALSLKAGATFTVIENGVPYTYTVSSAQIYAKTELEAIIPGTKRNRMAEITHAAKDDNGKTHKIVLMTCYERARGAAHRYVVYGD